MTTEMYCDSCELEVEVRKNGSQDEVKWECSKCGNFLGGMTFHKTLSKSEVKDGFY
jgi:ribosomal protein L37AE/L43A